MIAVAERDTPPNEYTENYVGEGQSDPYYEEHLVRPDSDLNLGQEDYDKAVVGSVLAQILVQEALRQFYQANAAGTIQTALPRIVDLMTALHVEADLIVDVVEDARDAIQETIEATDSEINLEDPDQADNFPQYVRLHDLYNDVAGVLEGERAAPSIAQMCIEAMRAGRLSEEALQRIESNLQYIHQILANLNNRLDLGALDRMRAHFTRHWGAILHNPNARPAQALAAYYGLQFFELPEAPEVAQTVGVVRPAPRPREAAAQAHPYVRRSIVRVIQQDRLPEPRPANTILMDRTELLNRILMSQVKEFLATWK